MIIETRILDEDIALAFIENMRWFAGAGKIRWKKLGSGRMSVTARRDTWSHFVV